MNMTTAMSLLRARRPRPGGAVPSDKRARKGRGRASLGAGSGVDRIDRQFPVQGLARRSTPWSWREPAVGAGVRPRAVDRVSPRRAGLGTAFVAKSNAWGVRRADAWCEPAFRSGPRLRTARDGRRPAGRCGSCPALRREGRKRPSTSVGFAASAFGWPSAISERRPVERARSGPCSKHAWRRHVGASIAR